MGDYNVDRRSLLTAVLAAVGSSVAGCLEEGDSIGNSSDSRDNGEVDDTDMNDSSDDASNDSDDQADQDSNHDTDGVHMKRFEISGDGFDFEESAAVTFNKTVTVFGTIMGKNTCYAARLSEMKTDNRELLVSIESYEDADEDEGCYQAEIGIHYEAVIEFDGELPTTITVEHNGEEVTTEQRS